MAYDSLSELFRDKTKGKKAVDQPIHRERSEPKRPKPKPLEEGAGRPD